jgi:hypothetical protein
MKYLLGLTAIFALACNSAGKDSDSPDTTVTKIDVPVETGKNCYVYTIARDTFSLQLSQNGNLLTGSLHFNNFEKDDSRGTVTGTMGEDVAMLWYSFSSEGMNSVMEVYFKKDGDRMIRGVGEMDVKGDTAYFKDKSKITYDPANAFVKTICN